MHRCRYVTTVRSDWAVLTALILLPDRSGPVSLEQEVKITRTAEPFRSLADLFNATH